jgi:hypothetical protein
MKKFTTDDVELNEDFTCFTVRDERLLKSGVPSYSETDSISVKRLDATSYIIFEGAKLFMFNEHDAINFVVCWANDFLEE